MNNSINNTLLALLIAIKKLEKPLTKQEEETITNIAEALSVEEDKDPEVWEDTIEPALQETIHNNLALNELFQSIKVKLDTLEKKIPVNLFPTEEELEIVVPLDTNQPKDKPLPEVESSDLESIEITNMSIRVMSTSETSKTVQELSRLEKLWEFLNQPINSQEK